MTRRPRAPGGVALIAGALVLALLLMPTASAGKLVTMGGPCKIGVSTSPPGAAFDPQCLPLQGSSGQTASGSQAPTDVSANLTGTHVTVSWDYEDQTSAQVFEIYRGAHPSQMSLVATTDDDHRTYTDTYAPVSGQSVYYAVGVVDESGQRAISQPVLISIEG